MSRLLAYSCLVAGLLGLSVPAHGDEVKQTGGKELKDTGKETQLAATTDFRGALGLNFESLGTLGVRIDQARTHCDPVGLAACAHELSVAEQTSGKKAGITSDELMKEAAEMARGRNSPQELKAVALLTPDEQTRGMLGKRAERAQKQQAARKDGEKTRGITGDLIVRNNTNFYISIFVNHNYKGTVQPFDELRTYVGHDEDDTTVLSARAGKNSWGPRKITGSPGKYTWTLTYGD